MTTTTNNPIETCRSCGAPIIWARTDRGQNMPIDVEPTTGGNVALDSSTGRLVARVLSPHLTFGRTDLHMPHHATCPHGKAWKRKRRPAR